MKKRFAILFIASQVFAIPFTINFQMVVKDDSGRPVYFQNENITFRMKGTVADFWAETKSITTPNGIINTRLGSLVPIDPVSFFAQDSVRLTVTRANGDTILSEPFNAVPFAFRAAFADTAAKARDAVNAQMLEGKRAHEFLDTNYVATVKKMISDSVWARGNPDPTNEIRDTANVIRGNARAWIGDTANAVRTDARKWIGDTANILRTQLRVSVTDSIAYLVSNIQNYIDQHDPSYKTTFSPGQPYDAEFEYWKFSDLTVTVCFYNNQPGAEKNSSYIIHIKRDFYPANNYYTTIKTEGNYEQVADGSDPQLTILSSQSNFSMWIYNNKLHVKAGSSFTSLFEGANIQIKN